MTSYRIYFTALNDRIVGRHDFEADDDAAAARIGYVLFEACSDACHAFELWEGSRKVRSRRRRRHVSLSDLADDHQQIVVQTEELISRSEWVIAQSRKLLERLDRLDEDGQRPKRAG